MLVNKTAFLPKKKIVFDAKVIFAQVRSLHKITIGKKIVRPRLFGYISRISDINESCYVDLYKFNKKLLPTYLTPARGLNKISWKIKIDLKKQKLKFKTFRSRVSAVNGLYMAPSSIVGI